MLTKLFFDILSAFIASSMAYLQGEYTVNTLRSQTEQLKSLLGNLEGVLDTNDLHSLYNRQNELLYGLQQFTAVSLLPFLCIYFIIHVHLLRNFPTRISPTSLLSLEVGNNRGLVFGSLI